MTVPTTAAVNKPTMVLLHGAFQDGQSTWKKVRPELESRGYKVVVVNLPGRDGDRADPKSLTTAVDRDTVLPAIGAEALPVVLVGHSFGGITISNVAEAAPHKIRALVYLSACLPKDGESLMTLAQTDRDSYLGKSGNLVLTPDYRLPASRKIRRLKSLRTTRSAPTGAEAPGERGFYARTFRKSWRNVRKGFVTSPTLRWVGDEGGYGE